MSEDEKKNWFVRILICVVSAIFVVISFLSFYNSTYKFDITVNIIILLSLVVIMILSESFDVLSIPKVITLQREVKTKNEEIQKAQTENEKLRDSLVKISTSIYQAAIQHTQNNINLNVNSDIGVKKVDSENEEVKELDDTDTNKQANEKQGLPEVNIAVTKSMSMLERRLLEKRLEQYAIDKFITDNSLNKIDLMTDVTFTDSLYNYDPIMQRIISYDGYLKIDNKEYFIEVKESRIGISSFWFDHLYVMISRIYYYKLAKNVQAQLVLLNLLIKDSASTEEMIYREKSSKRLFEIFQPAISNGLLKIETIDISKDDYDKFLEEIKQNKQ